MIKIFLATGALLFSIWSFFQGTGAKATATDTPIPMCAPVRVQGLPVESATVFPAVAAQPVDFETDPGKAYSLPLLAQTPNGAVMLSWTEKSAQDTIALCFALSKDQGKTFSDKKVVYAGTGVSNSRLFRAKVLAKKDGTFVAVFSNRVETPAPAATTQAPAGTPSGGGRGRGRRASELVYCESRDGGNTWSKPQPVDSDPTPGLMRGFFDAIVLPNDEVAVVYLKDVKGSTKHEERDLRMVLSKNGVFQPEKLLDPVVCDCCNINLLVDGNGVLHVYYRDNNDDVRDIARLSSRDNGETFSASQIVYADGWKIMGCPHSGASSVTTGKNALVAWFSGAETESGVRVVTQEGKKLLVLDDPSVKNPALAGGANTSVLLWEQGSEKSQLVFRTIKGEKVAESLSVAGAEDATNATGLVVGNRLLLVHEVKQESKRNGMKVSWVDL